MSETRLLFDCPWPVWAVLAGSAVLLLFVLFVLGRSLTGVRPAARRGIILFKVLAIILLTGIVLNPKLVRRWPDPQKPVCAVLVDGSRSMQLTDALNSDAAVWAALRLQPDATPERLGREEMVSALLYGMPVPLIRALDEDFNCRTYRFSEEIEPLPDGADTDTYRADPDGHATAIGRALHEMARGVGGERPRVVILVSDGVWNAGRDPVEAARTLNEAGTAVYAVGVGDPDPPRDVAVLDLRAPDRAILGERLRISARVAAAGGLPVPVQLLRDGEIVDRKTISPDPSGLPTEVTFSLVPEQGGVHRFAVEAPKQEGEIDDINNRVSRLVEVAERRINVLLIESEPRWEYRFLRSVLDRDPPVMSTTVLLRPGVGPIRGAGYAGDVPVEKKDLAEYDLVVIGDVPRSALPAVFLEELAGLVRRRGAGLLFMAGRREHYRDFEGTPLGELLPVRLTRIGPTNRGVAETYSPELTFAGSSHLATQLAPSPEENAAVWAGLPPIHWSATTAGLARGAVALLNHPHRVAGTDRLPLLAVQRVGAGKVMFVGIDETWRWRKSVGDRYHYRFWAQIVRWLTRKQFAEGDARARLSIDRTQCDVGDAVQVEAFCLGEDGYPVSDAEVRLHVRSPDGAARSVAMEPVPDGWGIYRAAFVPEEEGTYLFRPVLPETGEEPLDSTVTLEAVRADMERYGMAQNRALLEAIAEAGGGEYLPLHEGEEIVERLRAAAEREMLTAEVSPCRHPLYYTVLALALGAGWLIRKRSGLA